MSFPAPAPGAFALIFESAFNPVAATGGFAGAAVIILSGMYIVYRERVRARQARAA